MTQKEPKPQRRAGKRSPNSQDPAFYESLGHAIKVARTQKRLERKQLAEAAGVSYAYLSDIETGRGRPSSGALLSIAEALGMAPHELMLAAEGNQAMQYTGVGQMVASPQAMMEAPRARAAKTSSWFRVSSTESPPPLREDSIQLRAELDSTLEELGPEDLEMVLDLVHRIQGRRRQRPE